MADVEDGERKDDLGVVMNGDGVEGRIGGVSVYLISYLAGEREELGGGIRGC